MFRRLAHLGLVVVGVALAGCWGCSQSDPKGDSDGKKPGQTKEQAQPAPKDLEPAGDVKSPAPKSPEAKPAEKKTPEKKITAPSLPEIEPKEKKPDGPDSAKTDSTSGRSGRAVSKVLKHLMKGSEKR